LRQVVCLLAVTLTCLRMRAMLMSCSNDPDACNVDRASVDPWVMAPAERHGQSCYKLRILHPSTASYGPKVSLGVFGLPNTSSTVLLVVCIQDGFTSPLLARLAVWSQRELCISREVLLQCGLSVSTDKLRRCGFDYTFGCCLRTVTCCTSFACCRSRTTGTATV
jgi:hypothetical protein